MKLNMKDLLKDLTWMQIGAGALAAATSFFLSSSIGIAGSLIGAAVGSVVTTFSSAIYKSLFTASDEAIKKKIGVETEAAPDDQTHVGEKNAVDKTYPVGAHFAASAQPALEASSAPDAQGAQGDQATQAIPPAQATRELPGTPAPTAPAPLASRSGTDPDELQRVRSLVAQRNSQRLNRIVTAVSLVTGLAAVALCAVVILGATSGNGIGYRPAPTVRAPEPVVVDQTDGIGQAGVDPAGDIGQNADQSANAPADAPANAPTTDSATRVDGSTTVTGPTTDGVDEVDGAGDTTGSGDHEQIPGDVGTSGPEPSSPDDNAGGPDSPNDPNTGENAESPGADTGDAGDSYATDANSETPAALIVAE